MVCSEYSRVVVVACLDGVSSAEAETKAKSVVHFRLLSALLGMLFEAPGIVESPVI